MGDQLFVPADFAVPGGLTAGELRLEPLAPAQRRGLRRMDGQHRPHPGDPGIRRDGWPHEMSLAENLRDLERHAQDFAGRRGFTYTVLSTATGEVIGCVYIYPPPGENQGRRSAVVRSWVRADQAALDPVLYHAVRDWLERDWPFDSIEYAPRA